MNEKDRYHECVRRIPLGGLPRDRAASKALISRATQYGREREEATPDFNNRLEAFSTISDAQRAER